MLYLLNIVLYREWIRVRGTPAAISVFMSQNKELNQGYLECDRNSNSSLKHPKTFPITQVNWQARTGRKIRSPMPAEF